VYVYRREESRRGGRRRGWGGQLVARVGWVGRDRNKRACTLRGGCVPGAKEKKERNEANKQTQNT
jgi:hypothetical protein